MYARIGLCCWKPPSRVISFVHRINSYSAEKVKHSAYCVVVTTDETSQHSQRQCWRRQHLPSSQNEILKVSSKLIAHINFGLSAYHCYCFSSHPGGYRHCLGSRHWNGRLATRHDQKHTQNSVIRMIEAATAHKSLTRDQTLAVLICGGKRIDNKFMSKHTLIARKKKNRKQIGREKQA